MILSSKQRKLLESMAHDLEPAVRIGKFGVTPTVVQTVSESLAAQELIKVKILENATIERDEVAEALVTGTGASLIQIIGRIIILYRANPERKHRVEFPGMEPSTVPEPSTERPGGRLGKPGLSPRGKKPAVGRSKSGKPRKPSHSGSRRGSARGA